MKQHKTFLLFVFLFQALLAFSQGNTPTRPSDYLNSLDIYAKVVGVVLTGLGTLFGLPLVIMNFKKTKAEIRKLEREASVLTVNKPDGVEKHEGYFVNIEKSNDVVVNIKADPRFLGPLLLLLDFIIAWVILTLMSYFVGFFTGGLLKSLIILSAAIVLLIPILKESIRVRNILRPQKTNKNRAVKSK